MRVITYPDLPKKGLGILAENHYVDAQEDPRRGVWRRIEARSMALRGPRQIEANEHLKREFAGSGIGFSGERVSGQEARQCAG
jgi:hypothetical protein